MRTVERKILPNGIRLILVPEKQSLATTVMVLVEAGSKYEKKKLNGISHFLEHMCFKGTAKRPRPIDIASELDGLGAEYNAFTSHEFTSYYAKAQNESFEHILEIIADMYLNPTFNEGEIEKEKGVIVEEINMYEDMPKRRVSELFMELVYGDQPAGWSIAGTKEVVRNLQRKDFITYRGAHYLGQATTVVISGGFNPRRALFLVTKQFAQLKRGLKGKKLVVRESQTKPNELVTFKKSDQTHLVMGYRAFDMHDERRHALEVLSDIIGGGMGSRLFQKIREELGAAYYVYANADLYSDHGLFEMAAGVDHKKIRRVIESGIGEFNRLTKEKVGAVELQRAKNHLIGRMSLSLETSDQIGYFYGGQEIMGVKLESPEQVAQKISRVSADDIRRVARALIRPSRLNLAVIGPYRNVSFRDTLTR